MPTTSSYDIEDIIPEARTLANSGVATGCPLCGDQQLRCWNLPGIHYTLAHCSGCGFTGNPVHLRARTGEEPYSIAATGFSDHGPQIKLSRELPRTSQRLQKAMEQARRELHDHPEDASATYSRLIGHPPDHTRPLSNHLGWWNQDMSHQWETIGDGPYLALPEYVCGDLLVRVNLISPQFTHHLDIPLGNDDPPDGVLDMGEEGKATLVVSNLSDAGQVLSTGSVGGDQGNAPVILMRAKCRPFMAHLSGRPLVVPVSEVQPELLESIMGMPRVRFTSLAAPDIADQMEYGGSGVIRSVHEKGMSLDRLVARAAAEGHEGLLERIGAADIGKDRLCRIFMGAPQEASRAMRHHWEFLDHPNLAECGGTIYRRRPAGGYDSIDEKGAPKEISTVSMRVTERIVGPERTLCRGWARHNNQSVELELEGPFTSNTAEDVLRAFAPLGITSTPHWRCSGRRWMHINYAFSQPATCQGAPRSGYRNGTYFLPGVTITGDNIEPTGRITRTGYNTLPAGTVDRGSPILGHTEQAHTQMALVMAIGMHIMCTRPTWPAMTTYMMRSSTSTSCYLQRLAHSARLTAGWEGYPAWEDDIRPATPDSSTQSECSHVFICPDLDQPLGKENIHIPPTGWAMLWGALQVSLAEDSPPECVCQMMMRGLKEFSRQSGIRYSWDWTKEWLACNIL